ncbi:MAG: branched-chain amino acid ABC transporter permease, partial [Burkholderiaceae bacterium]
ILLFTFIGGVGFFFGPLIGSVIGVFLTVVLSEFTKAWLLYLGLVFLIMVMYAPGGIASLIMINVRVARFGKLRRVLGWYALMAATGALAFIGAAALIELIYHLQLDLARGPELAFMGVGLSVARWSSWVGALAVALFGYALFEYVRRRFAGQWGEIQGEIAAAVRARESA